MDICISFSEKTQMDASTGLNNTNGPVIGTGHLAMYNHLNKTGLPKEQET